MNKLGSEEARKAYHEGLSRSSVLDGREVLFTDGLRGFLSEGALHRYRAKVMVEAMIAFSESSMGRAPVISDGVKEVLRSLVTEHNFDARVVADYDHFGRGDTKPVEHDVKAVEMYLRERLRDKDLAHLCEWVHFPMTSEDVNNIAWNLMLRGAINEVWLPAVLGVMDLLAEQARKDPDTSVVGITHSMTASPTTIAKKFAYWLGLLSGVVKDIGSMTLTAKFGGAVGNHNAMVALLPGFDSEQFARDFVARFGFTLEDNTHQRNSHHAIANLLLQVKLCNTWCIDLCENVGLMLVTGQLSLTPHDGHAGSSVMPHKVNPWRKEVAVGYLEQSSALIDASIAGLMKSAMERDASDHPWERSYGDMIGRSLVGLRYIGEELPYLQINEDTVAAQLEGSWVVLAEAIQIAGRISGVPDIYNKVREETRGRLVDRALIQHIIEKYIDDPELRERLLALTPANYIGKATVVARREADRYRTLSNTLDSDILDTLSPITTVLFDFDGTLQVGDKEELRARLSSINKSMRLGFTDAQLQEFGNRSDWREMVQLVVGAFNETHIEERITTEAFEAVNKTVSGSFDQELYLAEGARNLLSTLHNSGRRMGLVTTRGPNSLPRLLRRHGIERYFSVVIDRSGCVERKPHPQPVLLALEKLGADPSSVLFVGDKQTDDVVAGKAAGCLTALISAEPLDSYGARPDYHFSSLLDLTRLFVRPAG